jgi:hypothetical protein
VPQPRDRDLRFAFAAELARIVLRYVDGFTTSAESVPTGRRRDARERYVDAPQLLVPNRASVGFTRLLGRSTRFRRTDGEYAVDAQVPTLGRWLTFLAERNEHPGSCLVLPMTGALGKHWASGQSAVEDQNLAALVGWIDPPPGSNGAHEASAAEDPLLWPPAGPTTDPTFDSEVLAPRIAAYDRAAGDSARERARGALEVVLRSQVEPTWRLMWKAIDLLRGLPEAARVRSRWDADRDAFTSYVAYLRQTNLPQPRRDGAVAAAMRLNWLERAQATYAAQTAFDDPLVMADVRLSGDAFAGTVVGTEPDRVDTSGSRRRLRPHITLDTVDSVRMSIGTRVVAPSRPTQHAKIVSLFGARVVVELSSGMGRGLTATPGSVPSVGEHICYTTLTDGYQPSARFPSREDTPWTHGGPPADYVPNDEDAHEEWS